jgi:ribonucleoside-diphosphate reductase beta chain
MKCNHIVCTEEVPEESWKLFFGDTGNFLRVDIIDYPGIHNIFKKMFSEVWAWTSVDFGNDALTWHNLDDKAQRIFLYNNAYQSLMDSGVVGIYNYLALLSSNTELSVAYQYVAQNESIHAGSYSYGLSQMFGAQAYDKINIVYEDEFIQKRMKDEVDFSDELFQYVVAGKNQDEKAKDLIFKAIVAAYALEHIKFPFSFFATWTLNKTYNNSVNGFSTLLKLIAQDELQGHTVLNANVLKILRREKRQEFQEIWDEEFIKKYIQRVVRAEIEWSNYLIKDGEIPGFTKKVNENFIKYQADLAMKKIGLNPIYNAKKDDSIKWFDDYRNIKNQNSALQEISNNSYNKGVVKNDIVVNLDKLRNAYEMESYKGQK